MSARFKAAIPKLASADIGRSLAFFEQLGFASIAAYPDYGIVERDGVAIHFWLCNDPRIAEATGCRIHVEGIDALFDAYAALNIIHPNDPLSDKPWGMREFSILDPDGNLVTFAEETA
ncbi:VOC family protein [Noviherbaspirillum cavernae]|uniref:Bleomycin resistance protein n=1 Tax=Noviherbaspirillum cavernae TaxID=2320862 RepID=A0A418X3A5_9BURK|nr:VOC family protein [Noviherbaspirillum cavernae]RJG06947.1 VOC family protein [Noviherbaspirillum cavernae]